MPLNQEQFVLDGMLAGWVDQQVSRGLAPSTITARVAMIRRLREFADAYPWAWTPEDLEAFSVELASGARPVTKSTLRGYQVVVRAFCDFITDARYPWAAECVERFGEPPVQICHEWNTLAHIVEYEGRPQRRALTYDELELFFTATDERVAAIQRAGRKGALSALRDAVLFKTVYAFGLRRSEAAGLDLADVRSSPGVSRFGECGAVYVRWGKASRGSGPKRRTVLAVPEFDWAVEGLRQWIEEDRALYGASRSDALWLTERGTRVSLRYLDFRFAELRDHLGLPPELTVHALRHSYVTNLIEWGYAERFVQDQVGHAYASTTAIYTSVGDDFKNRVLANALRRIYGDDS